MLSVRKWAIVFVQQKLQQQPEIAVNAVAAANSNWIFTVCVCVD